MFFCATQEPVATLTADTAATRPPTERLHVCDGHLFLVPALFLQFYCGNWPNRFSTPINVFRPFPCW